MCAPNDEIPLWINVSTGWDMNVDELKLAGERIANLRMAFEVREGNNPAKRYVPARVSGEAALAEGPHTGVRLDVDTLQRDYLEACGWDLQTCRPGRAKLEELGLADVADVLDA